MIDQDGFRPNVGIILANTHGQVLWAKRIGWDAWQFPQGGINSYETPEQALYRELQEEIGLQPKQVEVLACTRGWLRYRLPKHMLRTHLQPLCIGQKQKWFLLRMATPDLSVNTSTTDNPEFDAWRWVSYWYPVDQVVAFKRSVYLRAMKELCQHHSRLVLYHQNCSAQ